MEMTYKDYHKIPYIEKATWEIGKIVRVRKKNNLIYKCRYDKGGNKSLIPKIVKIVNG